MSSGGSLVVIILFLTFSCFFPQIALLHRRILSTFRVKCELLTDTLFKLKYSLSCHSNSNLALILEEYVDLMFRFKDAKSQQNSLEERYKFVIG